jgi:hypothetical protein
VLDGSRSQVLPMLQPLYRSCSRRRRMLLGVWAVVFVTPLGLNSAIGGRDTRARLGSDLGVKCGK